MWLNPITRPLSFVLKYFSVIYCTAEIYPSAKIGPGFCVSHSQMVMIGNHGADRCQLAGSRPGVLVTSDAGAVSTDARKGIPTIGDNVFLGMQSSVIGPVHIGDDAAVAAHSLVLKDVAPNTLVGGAPAKLIKVLDASLDRHYTQK
ncbi:MAG: DapH/DapD/GlmU-related protein [Marmoricola sp.]